MCQLIHTSNTASIHFTLTYRYGYRATPPHHAWLARYSEGGVCLMKRPTEGEGEQGIQPPHEHSPQLWRLNSEPSTTHPLLDPSNSVKPHSRAKTRTRSSTSYPIPSRQIRMIAHHRLRSRLLAPPPTTNPPSASQLAFSDTDPVG
jgi:hypothetical protein